MYRFEILQNYMVRKSKKQKAAFADYLKGLLNADGIAVQEMVCGAFKSTNLVVGDLTKAKAVFTAHYDTPTGMPVPNFITPCNMLIYLLYQILLTGGIFAVGGIVAAVLALLDAGFWVMYFAELLTVFGLLFLMLAGPANKNNANDNTSGVLALIKMIKEMPAVQREQCAFVFFDHEEAGLLGSSGLAKKYKEELKDTPLFNMDCIGEGDHVLLVYPKKTCADLAPMLEQLEGNERYSLVVKPNSKALYPSDQMNFKRGIGVATLKKNKVFGLYMNRIHTKKDTVCDLDNIDFVASKMMQVAKELTAH